MENSEAYCRGYNYYWHGTQPNLYEEGSVEHADWRAGWEDAAKEDRAKPIGRTDKVGERPTSGEHSPAT